MPDSADMGLTTRVLGLDLSLTATGVAHVDGTTEVLSAPDRKRAKGEHRTFDDDMGRLSWLVGQVTAMLYTESPDLVVMEDYAFSRGDAHSHALGELGGVVRLLLWRRNQPIALVGPSILKKFLTGKGNAGKDDMVATAARLGCLANNNNAVDAWALRVMGLYAFGQTACIAPTAYRDEAVAKVAWPKGAIARLVAS
jgi:crossover junction endodeoxyribonuclease RuvC